MCKKLGHTQSKCFGRFFNRYQSHLNMLVNEKNFLINQMLNIRKVKKHNTKPRNKKNLGNKPPEVKQV